MPWTDEQMCKIAASEFFDGCYVNLGIGMPTMVANYIPDDLKVTFQSENGMLGMGPFPLKNQVDADLINAGKQTVSEIAETAYFDSSFSFAMIRGGHIDLTILGALEVSQFGDLANWLIPGKMVKGPGGAMDLVAGAKRVVVMQTHTSKDGKPKIVNECALPLTGKNVVDRVITEFAVFDIDVSGLTLVKKADDITVEALQKITQPKFKVAL
jgi:3-oxoacid CoA-transferase subunit B